MKDLFSLIEKDDILLSIQILHKVFEYLDLDVVIY